MTSLNQLISIFEKHSLHTYCRLIISSCFGYEVSNALNKSALLIQKINPSTQRKEWVLVSRTSRRPLKYFGPKKPSVEQVKKEEQRIQYFKKVKGGLGVEPAQGGQGVQNYHLNGNEFYTRIDMLNRSIRKLRHKNNKALSKDR